MSGEDKTVDWGTYVQATHSRRVARYLAYAEAHSETSRANFDALEDERPNVLAAMDRAYLEQQWESVLSFMGVLKQYLHLQGHWGEAAKRVRYALDAAEHLKASKAQAHWTFYAGLIQDEQGNYEKAEIYYQESLKLAQAEGEIGLQAEVLRRLGWLAHAQEERGAAEERYRQAIELHHRIDDRQGQARDWRQLGLLAMEDSDFDESVRCLQAGLSLVEGADDWETQQLQSHVQLDLGRITLRQGRLDKARRYLKHALAHVEKAPNRLLEADIHFHLAVLAEKQGNLQQAASQYRERLELAREAGDRRGQASALIALGNLALQQPDYGQAQQCYEAAWQVGDRRDQAAATAQLGTLAYLQGDHQQATVHLQEALDVFRELNRRQEMAGCHQQLGLVAQARRQWREAEKHYQTSFKIRQELDLLHDAVQSLYLLGRLAQERGTLTQAQRYYQRALGMGESVNFSNLPMIRRALENLRFGER